MVRQGDKIFVPEGSALRKQLERDAGGGAAGQRQVRCCPRSSNRILRALPRYSLPWAADWSALKVALGDRVSRGQMVAVIDSPDLGQAYDDDAKAADTFKLAETNLKRQEAQHTLGAASDRDLDQAKSDHAQAAAEYARTQARLKMLGVPLEHKARPRLLTVTRAVRRQRHGA